MFLSDQFVKSTPDYSHSFFFQGLNIYRCANSIYWYMWGDWTFDIRYVRRVYNLKPAKAIDTNKKLYPCV